MILSTFSGQGNKRDRENVNTLEFAQFQIFLSAIYISTYISTMCRHLPRYRLPFAPIGWTVLGLWMGSLEGMPTAQAELPNPALVIKVCVNGLMYRNIFEDGTPGGPSTGVTQADAAIACRGVRTLQQARSTKLCVNGLLFTNITADGQPAGPSTGLTTRNAAIACSACPTPWTGDGR